MKLDGDSFKRTIVQVKVVADTNTFLAVALNEPEKEWLVQATAGCDLVAPTLLPYEIGNALSALARRGLIAPSQLRTAWDAAAGIPVELIAVDCCASLLLAGRFQIYAYDAYFLQCSLDKRIPLLTLDRSMKRIAKQLDITLVNCR